MEWSVISFVRNYVTDRLDCEIIVYGEEPRPAYDRVHLSSYFSGSTAEDLLMAPASWYADNNIVLACWRIGNGN